MINSFQLRNLNCCCIYSRKPVDGKIPPYFSSDRVWFDRTLKRQTYLFFFFLSSFFPQSHQDSTLNTIVFCLSELARLLHHPIFPGPRTLNLTATALGTKPARPLRYVHRCQFCFVFSPRKFKTRKAATHCKWISLYKNCKPKSLMFQGCPTVTTLCAWHAWVFPLRGSGSAFPLHTRAPDPCIKLTSDTSRL